MNKDVTDDPIVVALEPNDEGKRVLGTAIRICESQHRALHLINVVRPAITIYADLNFSPLTETALDWQRELLHENRAYIERMPELTADHAANLTVIEGNPIYEISKAIEKMTQVWPLWVCTIARVSNGCWVQLPMVYSTQPTATYWRFIPTVQ